MCLELKTTTNFIKFVYPTDWLLRLLRLLVFPIENNSNNNACPAVTDKRTKQDVSLGKHENKKRQFSRSLLSLRVVLKQLYVVLASAKREKKIKINKRTLKRNPKINLPAACLHDPTNTEINADQTQKLPHRPIKTQVDDNQHVVLQASQKEVLLSGCFVFEPKRPEF